MTKGKRGKALTPDRLAVRRYSAASKLIWQMTPEDLKEAADAVDLAAEHVWRSMKKFDGNPAIDYPHPIECPCADCT